MTERSLFASGAGIELASVTLPDGVVFRVGRASADHGRVVKGELFAEMATSKGSFLMSAPIRLGPPLKGAFGPPGKDRVAQWGLDDSSSRSNRPEARAASSRFEISVPEGVVWVELPTA